MQIKTTPLSFRRLAQKIFYWAPRLFFRLFSISTCFCSATKQRKIPFSALFSSENFPSAFFLRKQAGGKPNEFKWQPKPKLAFASARELARTSRQLIPMAFAGYASCSLTSQLLPRSKISLWPIGSTNYGTSTFPIVHTQKRGRQQQQLLLSSICVVAASKNNSNANPVQNDKKFKNPDRKSASEEKEVEVEVEEELPWIQEKALDLVEFTGSVTQTIPGPRVGASSLPWVLAVPLAYAGLTFIIAFVKTVKKFTSPKAKRRRLVSPLFIICTISFLVFIDVSL